MTNHYKYTCDLASAESFNAFLDQMDALSPQTQGSDRHGGTAMTESRSHDVR